MTGLARTAGWLVATVAVAAGTSYATGHGSARDATDTAAPPVTARATTTLTVRTIEPLLSLEGAVRGTAGHYEVVAPVEPADVAYRLVKPPLSIRGAVHGGPVGWMCAYRGLDAAAPDAPGVVLRCAVPRSVVVTAGLAVTVVAALEKPARAQALPLSAVIGGAQRGQVLVVTGGHTALRDVSLGRSDRGWIEVLGGLLTGETVLERPTAADVDGAS